MLEASLQLPQEQRFEIRQWRGFTDLSCLCPPGWMQVAENIDFNDDGSICARWGSQILCPDTPLTEAGNIRVERLACFKDKILIFQEKKIFCKDADGVNAIAGPKGDELMNAADEFTCSDSDTWNEHLIVVDDACSQPKKIYCNRLGQIVAKSVGLPLMNICPDVTPSVAGTANYVYAFFWCCEYTVASGKTFLDVGPVKFQRVENAPDFSGIGQAINITNIPELDCPEGFQFNLNNTELHIYRTANNGTTFFEVARIPTTQPTYQDGLQDNLIQNNQVIYNQGTTTQWTSAPPSSFVEVIDDVAWYAGRTCVDGVEFNNRIYQSIPGTPWSAPRDWYIEFEGEINGLSQYARFPIVSVVDDCGDCKLYRIQGRLDQFSRSSLVPYEIASATAAINNNSFVRAESGLYFFSTTGTIMRTDGYQVQNVMDVKCGFSETYCKMVETERQRKNVYGAYDKKHNRVYWAVTTEPGLTENNKILVYHEHHNAFTWYSNGDCFRPSALLYDQRNSNLLRGDSRGYTFEHVELSLTDPDINVEAPAQDWATKHIPWCIKTTPNDFGDCVSNKQVNKVYFRGKPETNMTFDIKSFDNGCKRPTSLNCVDFKHTEGWCSEEYTWCADPAGWCVGTDCHMYQNRRFPCSRTMTKDKTIEICAKDTVLECGTVEGVDYITFDANTNTICKANDMPFTRDELGQTIELASQQTATITFVSEAGKAVVEFEGAAPASGEYAWALRGFPKNQRACIDCMGFFYCVLGTVGGEFTAEGSKALSWETSING